MLAHQSQSIKLEYRKKLAAVKLTYCFMVLSLTVSLTNFANVNDPSRLKHSKHSNLFWRKISNEEKNPYNIDIRNSVPPGRSFRQKKNGKKINHYFVTLLQIHCSDSWGKFSKLAVFKESFTLWQNAHLI